MWLKIKLGLLVVSEIILNSHFSQAGDMGSESLIKSLSFEPEMVLINGGKFIMGSPADEDLWGWNDDEKQHLVPVSDFYIAKYEVTFEEWDTCVMHGGCRYWPADKGWGRGRHPVINVNWRDVNEYASWLSQQTGKQYRLPTEAEWEYAAREEGSAMAARYWGEQTNDACRYGNVLDLGGTMKDSFDWGFHGFDWDYHDCDDGEQFTAPVGSYEPNAKGLYDMLGNVHEWTCSAYEASYNESEKLCAHSADKRYRVLRGGSWSDNPWHVRSSYRFPAAGANRSSNIGFRLIRVP